MKSPLATRLHVILILAFVGASAVAAPKGALFRKAANPVRGQYVIMFHDDQVSRAHVAEAAHGIALSHAGRVLKVFTNGFLGLAVELPGNSVLALQNDPRIRQIEEVDRGFFAGSETYPSGDRTRWHLDRIDQRVGVEAVGSYYWTSSGLGVDVYVVDSGVAAWHSEFSQAQVLPGANYAGLDRNPPNEEQFPADDPCGQPLNFFRGGHGTAVASVVGGKSVGVARDVTLIPVKIINCDTTDPDGGFPSVGAIWALDWVIGQMKSRGRRSVVNMSFYFELSDVCTDEEGSEFNCVPAFEYNVQRLLNLNPTTDGAYGAVVVASANNQMGNHCDTQSPARMGYGGVFTSGDLNQRLVITVGGTNQQDQPYVCASCTSSDRGSNKGPCVSIYAPADVIHGAHIANSFAYRDQSQYFPYGDVQMWASGTSFAAPVVSGVAARLLQRFPTADPRAIWDYIRRNATTMASNFDGDGVGDNDRLVFISAFD